jgi:uncharacterized protein YejL (UPF0352 family)
VTTPETHEPESYRIPTPDGGSAKIVRTWSNTQVERIISDALEIVAKLDPPEDLRLTVFSSALQLTGQMTALQSGLAVAKRTFENGGI